jgi:hypothetical protein
VHSHSSNNSSNSSNGSSSSRSRSNRSSARDEKASLVTSPRYRSCFPDRRMVASSSGPAGTG